MKKYILSTSFIILAAHGAEKLESKSNAPTPTIPSYISDSPVTKKFMAGLKELGEETSSAQSVVPAFHELMKSIQSVKVSHTLYNALIAKEPETTRPTIKRFAELTLSGARIDNDPAKRAKPDPAKIKEFEMLYAQHPKLQERARELFLKSLLPTNMTLLEGAYRNFEKNCQEYHKVLLFSVLTELKATNLLELLAVV